MDRTPGNGSGQPPEERRDEPPEVIGRLASASRGPADQGAEQPAEIEARRLRRERQERGFRHTWRYIDFENVRLAVVVHDEVHPGQIAQP